MRTPERADSDASRPDPSRRTPVFVVGCPRSGTSLVYHALLASGAFPEYLAESMVLACSRHYGSLRRKKNRRRFADDFVESKQFRESGLDPSVFREKVDDACRDYVDVLRLFMDDMTRAHGKDRWVEKTPAHVWHVATLMQRFPSAKFIHVVRDGRDVAVSMRQHEFTPAYGGDGLRQLLWAGRFWQMVVDHVSDHGSELGGRLLSIRYEDVVEDMESSVDTLSEFAQVELSVDHVRSSDLGTLKRPNTSFDDRTDGVTARPVGRWRDRLEPAERQALEWALWESLAEHGYPHSPSRPDAPGLRVRAFAAVAPRLSRVKRRLASTGIFAGLVYNPLEFEGD